MYIYIHAVKLKACPKFGGFKVKNWSKLKVKNWSKFLFHCFPPHFYSVVGMLKNTNSVTLCPNSFFVFLQNCGDVKNEVFEKKIACLSFLENRNRKKRKKWKKDEKPFENSVF